MKRAANRDAPRALEAGAQAPGAEASVQTRSFSPLVLWQAIRRRMSQGELGPWPVLIGLGLIWLLFESQNDRFLTARNLSNLILQIGVVGTLAVGVVIILLLGEIDLSLGAVTGVTAGLLGVLLTTHGWASAPAILVVLVAGACIGLIQGLATTLLHVPSFIVTLAGLLAWQGVQLMLLGDVGELLVQDQSVRALASDYLTPAQSWTLGALLIIGYAWTQWRRRARRVRADLGIGSIPQFVVRVCAVAVVVAGLIALLNAYFGVPYILALLLAVVLLFSWLTERTVFGRHIYAIGGNAEAARRAGIRVGAVRVICFVLVSTLAAVAGVLSASRQFSVSTGTGGGTLLLDAIAAAVIGGVSLFGGRGRIYQAALGALVIGSVQNGLDLLGQSASVKDIATGVILVLAVGIDALSRRRSQGR
jgi:D-xylose transport system permease protein